MPVADAAPAGGIGPNSPLWHWLLAGTVATLAAPAWADTTPAALPTAFPTTLPAADGVGSASRPAAAATRRYDIAAGSLSQVLSRFAASAGILLAADGRLTAALDSPGLRGDYTVDQALQRLLQGTRLEAVRMGTGFTLQRQGGNGPDASDAPLVTAAVPLPTVHARATWLDALPGYRAGLSSASTRTPTATLELPQSLTVITQDLLRDQGAQTLAQALQWAPGVSMAQGEGNRESPVLRGASSTADFLIDGIRDDEQYYRDLYNTERVEVLRGPNAMIFGHGGSGGVINRVSKQPDWRPRSDLQLQLGSWNDRRATLDLERPLGDAAALRLNAMAELSDGFRDGFRLRRSGLNPTVAFRLDGDTLAVLSYEHFQDWRTADRGVPSYRGGPVDTDPSTFFGNPGASMTWLHLEAWSALVERDLGGGASLRNRLRYAHYDKFFQNVFPAGVRETAEGLAAVISAHNSRTHRRNLFNQTDLTFTVDHAGLRHLLLAGIELGQQRTDNRRMSGYFGGNPGVGSITVPLASPQTDVPVTFAKTATDPDNGSRTNVAAAYVQDQVQLSPAWSAVAGLRLDHLGFDATDRRQPAVSLASHSGLWSPRLGLVYQSRPGLSLYATHSVGYQPRSADQFLTLRLDEQALAPEKYVNREVGVKWAVGERLEASASLYQVDRHGVAVVDPADPTRVSRLVDGQRSRGLELGLEGSPRAGWQTTAGYAYQDSRLRASYSATAQAGATMPHVPRHSVSWWNRLDLSSALGVGLGIVARSRMFTSVDNTVSVPGFARLDGALYITPRPGLRLQLNVENLLDRRYFASAHSNSNISPGTPRAFHLGLNAAF